MALQWGNPGAQRNQYGRKTNLAMTAELTLASGNDGYGNNARINAPSYSTKAIGARGMTYFERPVTNEEISQAKGSLALLKSKKMKPSTTTNGDREDAPYALNSMLKYQQEDLQFQNPVPRRGGDGQFNTMDLSHNQPGRRRQVEENPPDVYTQDLYHNPNGNYRRQFRPPQQQQQQQFETEEPRTAYGNPVEVSTRKDRLLNRANFNGNPKDRDKANEWEKPSRPVENELPDEDKMNGKSRLNRLNTRKVEDRTHSQEPKNVGGFGKKNTDHEEEYQPPARGKAQPPQQQLQKAQSNEGYQPSALNNKPKARQPPPSQNPEDDRPAVAPKGYKDTNAGVPPDAEDDDGTRIECPEGCGRKFNEEALDKHVRICKKVFQTKRKEFDSAAMRQPEDENGYVQKKSKKPAPPAKSGGGDKKSKWRAQSEAFRAGMRAGKGLELTAEQKAAVSAMEDDSLTKCPCCGRKFNETAAKRHIPVCQAKAKNEEMKKGPARRR